MDSPDASRSINDQEGMESCISLRSRLKRQLDGHAARSPVSSATEQTSTRLIDKLRTSPLNIPPPATIQHNQAHRSRPLARKRQKVVQREQAVRSNSPPPQQSTWEPPVSPFGLIEEQLFHNPWKVFLACILLNRTSATQLRRIWGDLMHAIPDAQAGAAADPARLERIIQPLGFYRFRARAILAMSEDYLRPWRQPTELRFVGKYASDAYFIFCRGKWRDVVPEDKDLKRYCMWLESTGGHGTGLARDDTL
eukprot:jgi/Ulvmu1/9572/UM054_0002.1